MLDMDTFRDLVADLLDELPLEFFRELSGGVIVSEECMIPDYAKANDITTMGTYAVYQGGKQITIYKGSFDKVYPRATEEEMKGILRGVIRHEFRHHLEFLGGIRNSKSLEAEDERERLAYLRRHGE